MHAPTEQVATIAIKHSQSSRYKGEGGHHIFNTKILLFCKLLALHSGHNVKLLVVHLQMLVFSSIYKARSDVPKELKGMHSNSDSNREVSKIHIMATLK